MGDDVKQAIQRALASRGYELRRNLNLPPPGTYIDDNSTHLERLRRDLAEIPGMISADRCVVHYLMAYSQSLGGDIVEIGSWQGRHTCFLAAACRDSRNGRVHAVDHFQGNPGKEHFYVVGNEDLSDLEARFRQNVERHGLSEWVTLHASDAQTVTVDGPVRMLVIDGEHTYDAVWRDLERFAPLVIDGGMVVFDDYSPEFPGVVEAVQEWLSNSSAGAMPIQWQRSLIVRV